MQGMDSLVLEVVWSHLPADDLLTAAGVCRRLRRSVTDHWERRGIDIDMTLWQERSNSGDCDAKYRRMRCALGNMLPNMPKLKRLCVKEYLCSDAMSRIPLQLVAEHCRELEAIDLDPFHVSVDSVKMLCRSCPHLKEVTMPYVAQDGCLAALLNAIPALTSLITSKTGDLTTEEIHLLPTSLRYLGCTDITPQLQVRLNTDLSGVRELRAFYYSSKSADLHGCHSLKSTFVMAEDHVCALPVGIEHVYHPLTDDEVGEEKYPNLKTIVISYLCLGTLDVTAQKLAKLYYLRCVKVTNCEGFVDSARVLYGLVNLRELHIVGVGFERRRKRPKIDDPLPQGGASTDGWMVVADLISRLPSICTLAVLDCAGVNCLSEARFLQLGELVRQAHQLTLYSNWDGSPRYMDLPEWGYNLHPNGRMRIRNSEDWSLDFPEQFMDDEWDY